MEDKQFKFQEHEWKIGDIHGRPVAYRRMREEGKGYEDSRHRECLECHARAYWIIFELITCSHPGEWGWCGECDFGG